MVRPDVAGRKIAEAVAWLDEAEKGFSLPKEEFLRNRKERDLATFYLFLAIQECLDLAAHWVSDAGWTPPEDAAGAFDILADEGALEPQLASSLRRATGLRNRIAHGYILVRHERLYDEFQEGAPGLRQFLGLVAEEAGIAGDS